MKQMRKVGIVILILVVVVSTAVLAAPKDGVEIQASISDWQSTGIFVSAKKPVTITAEGSCIWGLTEPSVGPGGISYWLGNGNFLAPGLPVMSLVAKIGDGTPVFVGSGPVTLDGNGVLYLGFNDDIYIDNSGSFIVTISTTKPGNGYGDKNHEHSGPPGQQ